MCSGSGSSTLNITINRISRGRPEPEPAKGETKRKPERSRDCKKRTNKKINLARIKFFVGFGKKNIKEDLFVPAGVGRVLLLGVALSETTSGAIQPTLAGAKFDNVHLVLSSIDILTNASCTKSSQVNSNPSTDLTQSS